MTIRAAFFEKGKFVPPDQAERDERGYIVRADDICYVSNACYATWWGPYYDYLPRPRSTEVLYLHICDTKGGESSTPSDALLEICKEAAAWSTAQGVTTNVVVSGSDTWSFGRYQNVNFGREYKLKKDFTLIDKHYAFEVWLGENSPLRSDFLFTVLNLLRYLTYEYTYGRLGNTNIPAGSTWRDFWGMLFSHDTVDNHTPMNSDVRILGDNDGAYYRRGNYKYAPKIGKLFGLAFYDFYTRYLPANPPWRNPSIARDGGMASNVDASTWRTFYDAWMDSGGVVNGEPPQIDIAAVIEEERRAAEAEQARKEAALRAKREAEERRAEEMRRAAEERARLLAEQEQERARKLKAALREAREARQRKHNNYLNGDGWMPNFVEDGDD